MLRSWTNPRSRTDSSRFLLCVISSLLKLEDYLCSLLSEVQHGSAHFRKTFVNILVFFPDGFDLLKQLSGMGSFLGNGLGLVDPLIDPVKLRFRLLAYPAFDLLVRVHYSVPPWSAHSVLF